jgi:hypothetical protein
MYAEIIWPLLIQLHLGLDPWMIGVCELAAKI